MWQFFLESLAGSLESLHGLLAPVAGPFAWGLAIVGLTLAVRVALVPLGVVQAHTIRRRRALEPKVDRIRRRFDTSEALRRRDPDRYLRNLREQRSAVAAFYREQGVRPGTTFAVLLLQSPVLFGLYRVLASPEMLPALQAAPFVLIEQLSLSALAGAGLGAVILVAIVAATTWVGHQQIARSTPAQPGQPPPAVMGALSSGVIAVVATTLPAGLLVYWATAGAWTVGQQALLLR